MIAVMIIAPLTAVLVQAAISRGREFEADRGGAIWLAYTTATYVVTSGDAAAAFRRARTTVNPLKPEAASALVAVPEPAGSRPPTGAA